MPFHLSRKKNTSGQNKSNAVSKRGRGGRESFWAGISFDLPLHLDTCHQVVVGVTGMGFDRQKHEFIQLKEEGRRKEDFNAPAYFSSSSNDISIN